MKFWTIMAARLIVLNPGKLKVFSPLTYDKIKLAIKMCQLMIYKPGEEVNMKSGGVLYKGSLEIKYQDLMKDQDKDKIE